MLCPGDFCGGTGADSTDELVFRSEPAIKRSHTEHCVQFAEMLGLEVLREDTRQGKTALGQGLESNDVKWGNNGSAMPGRI